MEIYIELATSDFDKASWKAYQKAKRVFGVNFEIDFVRMKIESDNKFPFKYVFAVIH